MMRKTGTEQHFFTVRGRGFDHKQWKAVTELSQGIVARAKEAGIAADFTADARRIIVTSSEEGVSPLVIWRKGEPGVPNEVTTRGKYDALIQSILTAAKKVAPDIFVMTAPDGRDYRRLLAKKSPPDLPEVKDLMTKNRINKDRAFLQSVNRQRWPHEITHHQVKFVSLPKSQQTELRHSWNSEYGTRFDEATNRAIAKIREGERTQKNVRRKVDETAESAKKIKQQTPAEGEDPQAKKATTMTEDSIRKAAIRVAATTEDSSLKKALLEILREDTVVAAPEAAPVVASEPDVEAAPVATDKEAKKDEKKSRHEEGKSVDVGDYLKSKGHDDDAAKWETHEGDMGKKSSAAVVFPSVHELAWHHVIGFSKSHPKSKTASVSTADRVAAADHLANKWIREGLKRQPSIRKAMGVPTYEKIGAEKLDRLIQKVTASGTDPSLLVACLVAKHLEGMSVKQAADDTWLNEETFAKAATEIWGAEHLAKKWIQDAIKSPGRVREFLNVPAGKDIPMGKLDTAITKEKGTSNKSLLSALLLAKRLKKMHGKSADQAAA